MYAGVIAWPHVYTCNLACPMAGQRFYNRCRAASEQVKKRCAKLYCYALTTGYLTTAMPFRRKDKSGRRRSYSLREKLLTLALMVVSTFSLSQMVSAQRTPELPMARYADSNMQAFERAETNFPGSSFYYLDDDAAMLSANVAQYDWDNDIDATSEFTDVAQAVGPAAPSTKLAGSSLDKARALQCLTTAIYYEAALEPDAGQRAVTQVILNRVRHPSYPDTVCGVIYQGSERRTGCQFSFSCDGSMARTPSKSYWNRARRVASDALSGKVYAPAGLATHYHTTEVSPYWAPSLHFLGTIGAHRFYRWKGSAGTKSAFYKSYRGSEPLPAPKPKAYAPAPAADPIQLAREYEKARKESERQAELTASKAASNARLMQDSGVQAAPKTYAPPAYSEKAKSKGGEKTFKASNLPDNSQIRDEYRESGQWISRPSG